MPEPAAPTPSRDQRIEELLLAGLDRYFAGELERAIQVWSRVFFLDRGHARARAYIDRARGALAERQREAEARWHRVHGTGIHPGELGVIATSRLDEAADMGLVADALSGPGLSGPGLTGPGLASPALAATALAHAPIAAAGVDVVAETRAETSTARHEERSSRQRLIAQALLVALAALLLFGAGYVVAARDRLAAWWAPASAPALSVPAMAPENRSTPRAHDAPAGSSTSPRGTATR